jgi:hypothetical protein
MSFLSILKKIGQEANKFDEAIPIIGSYAHMATSLIPGDRDDKAVDAALQFAQDGLVRFQNIILDAEVFGQAAGVPGPQKAIGVAPAVLQLFLDLPVIKGKRPKDPEVTKADAAALGGALAKFLNGFE